MKNAVLITILILTLYHCKKKNSNPPESVKHTLVVGQTDNFIIATMNEDSVDVDGDGTNDICIVKDMVNMGSAIGMVPQPSLKCLNQNLEILSEFRSDFSTKIFSVTVEKTGTVVTKMFEEDEICGTFTVGTKIVTNPDLHFLLFRKGMTANLDGRYTAGKQILRDNYFVDMNTIITADTTFVFTTTREPCKTLAPFDECFFVFRLSTSAGARFGWVKVLGGQPINILELGISN